MRMLLMVGCLLAIPLLAMAQDWVATPGVAGTQAAAVRNANLRLPPGSWELIGSAGHGSGNNNSSDQSKLFMQTDGGRIAALLLASASAAPLSGPRARWLVPADCGRIATYV
jgi:hypothetical protein